MLRNMFEIAFSFRGYEVAPTTIDARRALLAATRYVETLYAVGAYEAGPLVRVGGAALAQHRGHLPSLARLSCHQPAYFRGQGQLPLVTR
jgi:hypothetical protein